MVGSKRCIQSEFLASSVVSRGADGREQLPPKFWAVGKLSENLLLIGRCLFENAKFGAKYPHSCWI